MQLFWNDTKNTSPHTIKKTTYGDVPLSPGTVGFTAGLSLASPGVMFQGFPGDLDSGSRESSSLSIESQYISSVDSFGSPPTTSAPQECVPAGGGLSSVVSSGQSGSVGVVEMPGSFVPTVTAITSSQDLQWMVQPTLISSQASGLSLSVCAPAMTHPVPLVDPYDMPGPSYTTGSSFPSSSGDPQGSAQGPAPGPVRSSRIRSRRAREESVSDDGDGGVLLIPEEEEKRRVRRERNKLAAAKCRNRRRELTDRLQSETDVLEEEKSELESEISELHKEKERLEFVLVAHQPGCKIPYQDQQQQQQQQQQQSSVQLPPARAQLAQQAAVSIVGLTVKEDDFFLPPPYTPHPASSQALQQQQQQQQHPLPGLMQEVAFSSSFYGSSQQASGGPCQMACDGGGGGGGGGGANHDGDCNPSYTSSFVFTYPEGGCGVSANQRNSSSEQSSDSLNSPSLLAL